MMGSSLGLKNLCSYRFSLASQGACAQVRVKLVPEKVLSTTNHWKVNISKTKLISVALYSNLG